MVNTIFFFFLIKSDKQIDTIDLFNRWFVLGLRNLDLFNKHVKLMLTYIVNLCTQTSLHQSNGVTIYLLVGSLSILRLRPKTCLDSSVFSPVFPSVFPFSHSNTLTPPDFFQPPFLCHVLLLIVSSYWGCHHYLHTYTHIPTFIKIPRDPHEFRGVPWNLFRH